jgi:hypothetical protein
MSASYRSWANLGELKFPFLSRRLIRQAPACLFAAVNYLRPRQRRIGLRPRRGRRRRAGVSIFRRPVERSRQIEARARQTAQAAW